MNSYGVWAYLHLGDVKAGTQGEAQALAKGIVETTGSLLNVSVIGVTPDVVLEDDAGGVCC